MTNGYEKLVDLIVPAVKGMVARMLSTLEKSLVDRIEAIPAGPKGEDGAPGEKGEPGEKGLSGDAGAPGKDGEPGRDGRDGLRGEHGKDGLQIEPLSTIDLAKSYPRGTWASFRGGLWRSARSTSGMDGWECLVNGFAGAAVVQDPEDPRRIAVGIKSSDGQVTEQVFRVPVVIDRGIFKEGDAYESGDGVTWGGSFWIAQDVVKGKPGDDDSGWRLAVKKGRDGRDGLRGEKGERGAEGRAGRDLTQRSSY